MKLSNPLSNQKQSNAYVNCYLLSMNNKLFNYYKKPLSEVAENYGDASVTMKRFCYLFIYFESSYKSLNVFIWMLMRIL